MLAPSGGSRPAESTCANCEYYDAQGVTNDVAGICRRLPPIGVIKGSETYFGWPNVDEGDWCGEHEPVQYPA